VKILLDCSAAKIVEYRARYGHDFGQLRTPLTNYALADDPAIEWAADNGFFVQPDIDAWLRFIDRFDENRARRPLFVVMPDIVGDAARTAELFEHFKLRTNELPRALAIQDGIEHVRIPWNDLRAVFIGGSTAFKSSPAAFAVARTARLLGKHVHVGRINTAPRMRNWLGLADTGDGSGMDRFDHMLEDVLAVISDQHPQQKLSMGAA
jgi:hypothetical protein